MLTNCLAECTHLSSTVSQLFEPQFQKSPFSPTAAHIFVSPIDAPASIRQYVASMERQFNACQTPRSPSNYNRFWDRARYLWKNRHFIIPALHSTPPLGGFPSEYRHPLWYGKTRMVSLPDGEKNSNICLFVLTWSTNVADSKDRACIASRGKNLLFRWEEQLSTTQPSSCQRSSGGNRSPEDKKVISGSSARFDESVVNRRSVTGVRVRETYDNVSTEEDTVILPWARIACASPA